MNEAQKELAIRVLSALITQGGRSLIYRGPHSICAYRGEQGRKCAVGHLISDEEYSPKMEFSLVRLICDSFDGLQEIKDNIQLVQALQFLHDSQTQPDIKAVELWKRAKSCIEDGSIISIEGLYHVS